MHTLKSSFLGLLTVLALNATSLQADKQTPNILIFLVDDMGLMDTTVPFLYDAQGKPQRHPLNQFYRTPSMERLASQGIRFSQFYAMSVCSPTRASLMTGQTSARHYVTQFIRPETKNTGEYGPENWKWRGFDPGEATLASRLRDAGYHTIHSGKAHFGPIDSYAADPANLGFDVNIAGCAYGAPGSYYGKDDFGLATKRRKHRAVPGLEKYHGQDIHLSEALTLELNQAITDAVEEEKPFFAYMSHYAVHGPFQSDPRFAKNYAAEPNKNLAAYASMIEGMDKSLGDILDHLENLGVAENTIVFFLGDNGSDAPMGPIHEVASSAPLRGKKGTHYEGGMRVPFIAAWAKPDPANPHQKRNPVASNALNTQDIGAVYDLFPTILNLAEAPTPERNIDGIDLAPLLAGETGPAEDRDFLMHFPHEHRSSYYTVYRKGEWKLIYHYRHQKKDTWDPVELYDLSKDPYETANLAARNPRKKESMIKNMRAALKKTNAQSLRSTID
ncbi:MAG: sulfatase [Verrucomicrobiota bacterium]